MANQATTTYKVTGTKKGSKQPLEHPSAHGGE